MRTFGIVCKYIAFVLLSLILAFCLHFIFSKLILKVPQPRFFGYSSAVVKSDSMKPEFVTGDLLFFKAQDEYEVGDIVIFSDGNSLVTHRIVDVQGEVYITKGDANNTNDDPVLKSNVYGKMTGKIGTIGYVIEFFRSPTGLIIVVSIAIVLIALPSIIKSSKGGNKFGNFKRGD